MTAPDRVTAEELADVARLDAAATPGPWEETDADPDGDATRIGPFSFNHEGKISAAEADRWFAREGRTLLPRLASEAAALRDSCLLKQAALDLSCAGRQLANEHATRAETERDAAVEKAEELAAEVERRGVLIGEKCSEVFAVWADFETLRTKAGAYLDADEGDDNGTAAALRAELDKPSGASLTAELESLRCALTAAHEDGLVARHNESVITAKCDAWKALAKAYVERNRCEARVSDLRAHGCDGAADEEEGEWPSIQQRLETAEEDLRALGVDPEQP